MIHLTIDGIPVEVEKGTTILQAAKQIGVKIPTLCYLENVLPDGSCRLCVVEVTNNGRTKFDTACTLRCSEGDEVQTMSEKVVKYRKETLDLLLSDHRVHCFSCEANGDCKLQDYCFEYGVEKTSFPGEMNNAPIDDTNKFFTYDPSLCILCHRCVNTCKEIVGRGAIDTMNRGFQSVIGAHYKNTWNEGICESCGNCVQACPTGALTMKDATFDVTLEHYTKGVDGAADLRNGRIDALIIDKPVAETFLGDDNDLKIITDQKYFEDEKFGIAVKKGETEVVKQLNEVLKAMTEDGTIDKIILDYVGVVSGE